MVLRLAEGQLAKTGSLSRKEASLLNQRNSRNLARAGRGRVTYFWNLDLLESSLSYEELEASIQKEFLNTVRILDLFNDLSHPRIVSI